jgi:hypothetical protein
MIRRDFIIRMIEELGRALAQIRALRHGSQSEAAIQVIDAECEKFVALGVKGILGLSETELVARVSEGQLAQTVHFRTLSVVTLLCEAAAISNDEGREEEAREIHLKALRLLLEVLSREDPLEFPEFVPKVESILRALQSKPLPAETQTMLMRHYEATGQFAKAEDCLFTIIDDVGPNPAIAGFGRAFYERILRRTDQALAEGDLPRGEAKQGLEDFLKIIY